MIFLKERIEEPKSEFFIPLVVNKMIKSQIGKMKVLNSEAQWFGVTYQEDKPIVQQKLKDLVEEGVYPESLWV